MTEPTGRRATDAERRRTVDLLTEALSEGQITMSEFDERSAKAFAAMRQKELISLLEDLRDDPAADILGQRQVPLPVQRANSLPDANPTIRDLVTAAQRQVTGEPGTSRWSVAIMGGVNRKHWVVPGQHTSIAVMGGNEIDLRDARFETGDITIDAYTLMGGIQIIVPEGVRVECNGLGLMGGYAVNVDKSASVSPTDLPPDAPVVRVRGVALMGGVEVRVKPRRG
ncbi:DUF1707 SHOCT-like domain-containing protein [Corynebacterium sputi]|uniref:DUF1707 SHOCT-like domain-containing protein n=1 Tax=Corynebacterium sputi TaxID=489915 RepID=UPI000419A91A|nr:DUF1707 domain-containing protein [Corynebacterium sputi]